MKFTKLRKPSPTFLTVLLTTTTLAGSTVPVMHNAAQASTFDNEEVLIIDSSFLTATPLALAEEMEGYHSTEIDSETGEIISVWQASDKAVELEHQRQLQAHLQEAFTELKGQYGNNILFKVVTVEDDEQSTSRFNPFGRVVTVNEGRAWTPWRYVGTQGFTANANGLTINVTGGANISVSVGFQWGPVSVGVSAGAVNNSGVSMTTVSPTSHHERRVRPQIRNEIDRLEQRIYYSNVSANGPWTFLTTRNTSTVRTTDVRQVLRP